MSCCLAPSIARVANPTFLTHLLVSMPQNQPGRPSPFAPSPRSAA
jgi:hypothetical protein